MWRLVVVALVGAVAVGCAAPAAAPQAATRTVEHVRGPIEIPADPQRIVVLDSSYLLDNLVGLGFGDRIVGRSDFLLQNGEPPSWLVDDVDFDRIELVGGYGALDLEKIAALRPDLIVGFGIAYEQHYDALSRIAPALVPDEVEDVVVGRWQPLTTTMGRLLDREERAAELIAAADAHLAERVAAAPPGFTDRSLSVVVGSHVGDLLSIAAPDTDGVWLLDELGFRLNPQYPDLPRTQGLAPEQYGTIDADAVLMLDYSAGTIDFRQLLSTDPVASRVPAVERGDVYVVEGISFTTYGPVGAIEAMDQLFTELAR